MPALCNSCAALAVIPLQIWEPRTDPARVSSQGSLCLCLEPPLLVLEPNPVTQRLERLLIELPAKFNRASRVLVNIRRPLFPELTGPIILKENLKSEHL